MAAITPIQESDLEFDNGTFDAAAFTAQTLSELAVAGRGHRPHAAEA